MDCYGQIICNKNVNRYMGMMNIKFSRVVPSGEAFRGAQKEYVSMPIVRISHGRSQDGRGIGWGDHFLSYKFIERTIER